MAAVLIATSNKHKVEEIRSILGSGLNLLTLADFPDAPKPVEDAPDFRGNAAKKAVTLAEWLAERGGMGVGQVLADDSGLEADALHGAPGVLSARFAASDSGRPGNSPDAENNAKLLRLLEGVPPARRTARFRCAIALAPVPESGTEGASPVCLASEAELGMLVFEGSCEGRILEKPRGSHGFGYDPLFVPDGFEESYAELGERQKNEISHRARALRKLQEYFSKSGQ